MRGVTKPGAMRDTISSIQLRVDDASFVASSGFLTKVPRNGLLQGIETACVTHPYHVRMSVRFPRNSSPLMLSANGPTGLAGRVLAPSLLLLLLHILVLGLRATTLLFYLPPFPNPIHPNSKKEE